MTSVPRIFISYSRQDGAAAAAEIRERLAAEGLSLWQDLVAMEGGRDWWRQIEEAIGKAEYLILLLTPKALESEVCAKEWRYARQQGTYVVPLSDGPPGKLELYRLAGWMRRADMVDFRIPERWTWLVGKLKQPPQVRRVPMMAEAPPSDFVPRPAEFAKLKAALLDPATKDAVGITAALKGAGGYGKTTLARALCGDEEIQDAYHDGVLWVTLGESPGDPLGRVADLIEIVAGGRPGFANVEAACVRLEELLAERRMLVVIDDAWSAADTRPFLRGGPHCARLITTRDGATLPRGTAEQPVDEMRGAEAVALLCADLPPGEDEALRRLAARLGEWPLLLRLANGALVDRVNRSGASLPDALVHVGRLLEKRGLTAFDAKDPKERREAVGKTLAISLDRLDLSEQARLLELAVFPEDVQVPLGTVELLWRQTGGLDEIDMDELLQRLYGLSLLLQLDLDRRFLQLHDVIRTWLRERLGGGLGEVDEALVAAFRSRCDGEWHRLDDRYALAHLPMHLRRVDEVAWRHLLLDPRWMARQLAADGPGVAAIIDDYGGADDDLRFIGDALRLSAHVIGRDPRQLSGQLCGRLDGSAESTHAHLVAAARANAGGGILLPRRGGLTAPGGPLLRTLKGHASIVTAVAVLLDGRRALSASGDWTLKLWDLESGQLLRTLEGHAGWVDALALLPDGRRALSASGDRTLKLWDLETGAVLRTLEGHGGWVNALALLPDGRRAISGESDNTVKLWDLKTGAVLRTFEGHGNGVAAVALLPDGRHAISGSWDRTLKIWDLESGQLLHTLEGLASGVSALALLPDGRHALSASGDGTLTFWDLESGQLLRTLEGHGSSVNALALLPDARRALSASDDGTLKLWDLETCAVLRIFEGHGDRVIAVALLPDGRRAISGSQDSTLKLWDLERSQVLRIRARHSSLVTALGLLPDGRCALSASRDRTLKLWELESGQLLRTLDGHAGGVTALGLLPDGRCALSASDDKTLKLWDLETGTVLRTFEGHSNEIAAVALLPDGRRALSAGVRINLWDLETGETLRALEGHQTAMITAVAVLHGGHHVLTAAYDGNLKLWDLESGQLLRTLDGHAGRVTALALLPDGRRALSGGSDNTLNLWDLESGIICATWTADQPIECVAAVSNRYFIAGDGGGTLHFLDLVEPLPSAPGRV